MDLSFGDEIERFREEVRTFIRENLPDDIRRKVAAERMDLDRDDQKRWQRILYDRGWAAPHWPREYGGVGWTDAQFYVFERELALNDAPRTLAFGLGMLGPTVVEFGTEEQKQRLLPPTQRGDILWCQGFSEPNAGSDLASLQCRARLDGDAYVVDGNKIWTTEAHTADWIFGLFRTDSSGKKQHGITFLMIDLQSPGVTVQPIPMYEGTREINQVFFDGVRVPVENRLGEEHQGWGIAKYLLGLERFGTAEVSRSLATLGRLRRLSREISVGGRPLAEHPWFAEKLADAETELRALELTEQRFLFGPGGGDALGAEASILKVRGTEVQQRLYELMVEALGPDALLDAGPDCDRVPDGFAGPDAARFAARACFNFRKTSIYSGSNEIQKNIVAKAVLGL